MKISKIYKLDASQYELDFVDIDPGLDTPLFLDPFFLSARKDKWSSDAYRTLKSFFQTLVNFINSDDLESARALLDHLHEPNETCLGLSSGAPKGNAIGDVDGDKLFESIIESKAVQAGIVEDIQDFRLFIDGIDKDKISDLTTNIIKRHLISYTQSQCKLWGIELKNNVSTGYYWSSSSTKWQTSYEEMLVIKNRPIILVPKAVVSYAKKYTPRKYYTAFVLEYLREDHLQRRTKLVQRRRDGTPFVTKKLLALEYPYSKEYLAEFTQRHPDIFSSFKEWIISDAQSIPIDELSELSRLHISEYLSGKLTSIPPENESATQYHKTVAGILDFLFYPDLFAPLMEVKINSGRKRVDITFDNGASKGFFYRLHTINKLPAQYIFVECKNYTQNVANPELDQLSGRFSYNRGMVGFLLYRQTDNLEKLIASCADTYQAGRGAIIPLCDEDLQSMLYLAREEGRSPFEKLLSDRLRDIILK